MSAKKTQLIITILHCLNFHFVTPSHIRSATGYYNCTQDYCLCCFKSNHIDEAQPQIRIKELSRLYVDFSKEETDTNEEDILNSGLKKIRNSKMVYYRTCSNPNQFESNAVIGTNMWSQQNSTLDYTNIDGIAKCLRDFCTNNTHHSRSRFLCHDDNIRDLETDYENRLCFSTMQYVIIESSNLVRIENEAFFANRNIQWNIIYLRINFATTAPVTITCNAFQLLTKLRTLKLDLHYFKSYKCIFHFNPDLVTISSYNIRIWNMCNGSLDVWKDGEYRNESIWTRTRNVVIVKPEEPKVKGINYILIIVIITLVMFVGTCLMANKWKLSKCMVYLRDKCYSLQHVDGIELDTF